tara:strand:+ start:587 stop:1216 length:630 start_codon:yes stop_codon:yes gene_type:complete
MKKLAFATVLGLMSSTAYAVEFDGSAGVVSNYVWRGATQSDGKPALQGSVGLTTEKGFYANAWGSQVDYGDDTTAEVDLTVGFSNDINEVVSYDVGYIKYSYTGDDVDFKDDAGEVFGTLSLGPVSGTIFRDMDNETSYYAGSVAISDILGIPFDAGVFAGRNDNSDMDAGITLGNSFIDDKINVSYSYTWSETDVEDSAHSLGIFYTF